MSDQAEAPSPTVLFVDDEPSILSALRRLFRPHGFRVLLAEGGAAGLEILAAEPVDVVVSDMRMPEMDGAAFLEQVRERWPDVGRILLTGYADIGATVAAINRGEIHRYIAKPWEDRDLLLCVRDAFTRRQLEGENRSLQRLTQQQNQELQQLNADLAKRVKARTEELEQVNAMLEKSFAQLHENFMLSLNVFAGLLELREGGMAGYSRQVAALARNIVHHLKGGTQLEQDVYAAGLLHEIGMIGFPDALLHKPVSSLTGDELQRYRQHTLNGEAALLPLGQLQRAARFVRSQHERIDGRGYPDGLGGTEVPLGAQVLGLASDFYGAQAGRLAHKRYSESEARSLIRGGAGTRYESTVVEAFEAALADVPTEKPLDRPLLPHEIEPGMVLARDLLSPQGTLLLAAGFVFDARVVRQIRDFASRYAAKLTLHIKLPPQDPPLSQVPTATLNLRGEHV
jgi:response regulator RpfG family c-di-GMP phosphodiesterase